ncbi:proline rich transmembrane protein 1B-like [Dermochelys coriacea]|uniref:proline rich transmembrane protein 1B-like n=1 Tax=Dermochelys coriacea TaxID=27794 RepID=UPI0018E87072|nr:proline rich transmembrane protein 1B-like [Dermochelys coriacea]
MSYPGYDKGPELCTPAPAPPYSNLPPYGAPPPLLPSGGQFPTPSYGAAPVRLPNQQGYYPPYNEDPNWGPMGCAPQQVILVSPPPAREKDYLGYSIFTLLCCCLPLGIVALVYSIQTRDANGTGNTAQAQRSSRMAWIFNNTALGVGIVVLIVWVTIVIAISLSTFSSNP